MKTFLSKKEVHRKKSYPYNSFSEMQDYDDDDDDDDDDDRVFTYFGMIGIIVCGKNAVVSIKIFLDL